MDTLRKSIGGFPRMMQIHTLIDQSSSIEFQIRLVIYINEFLLA